MTRIKQIVLDTPHGVFVETMEGRCFIIPKNENKPEREVICVCYCEEPYQGRH